MIPRENVFGGRRVKDEEAGQSSSGSSTSTPPAAAPPGQFSGTPITQFPQYTSGSWANLPPAGPAQYMNGAWGLPPPPSSPPPSGNNPLSGLIGGSFGQGSDLLSSLFGGGLGQQPNPSSGSAAPPPGFAVPSGYNVVATGPMGVPTLRAMGVPNNSTPDNPARKNGLNFSRWVGNPNAGQGH